MQKTYERERTERLTGMNGEQEYLLIEDHLTGKLRHMSSGSKNITLNFLNICLTYNNPLNVQNNYVLLEQGSEMSRNPTIVSLLEKYGYVVIRTSPDASHQNSPAKTPHRYIVESVGSLMEGH